MHLMDRTISILLRCLMWYFQTSLAQIHSKKILKTALFMVKYLTNMEAFSSFLFFLCLTPLS